MLKVQSTVYPPSRNGGANPSLNTIREGGLWYSDKQNELEREAQTILNCPLAPKRKYEFKEFAKIFWIVVVVMVVGIALYQLID